MQHEKLLTNFNDVQRRVTNKFLFLWNKTIHKFLTRLFVFVMSIVVQISVTLSSKIKSFRHRFTSTKVPGDQTALRYKIYLPVSLCSRFIKRGNFVSTVTVICTTIDIMCLNQVCHTGANLSFHNCTFRVVDINRKTNWS